MIEVKLKSYITEALAASGAEGVAVILERPDDLGNGDFSTNVAMAGAKKAGKNPRMFADEIVLALMNKQDEDIAGVEAAGPGFINFRLSKTYFQNALTEALALGTAFGENNALSGKKTIVEYTDPNPFKEFHIGHLMSNTIGESVARLTEASNADTKRACYQGDVGMHVAKAVWGMKKSERSQQGNPSELIAWLSQSYALGAMGFEKDEIIKKEVTEINKKIYQRSDPEIDHLYDLGRKISLAYFETIYARLGTKFDHYFFESETAGFGKEIVEKHPLIFETSDGAIVYKGDESMGLHTRVFITKEGLPTYEAKELGLAKIKYDASRYDISIVITGNEVNDYFKVLLDAMGKVFPELAAKTEHYSHGMLRLTTGKMSSRTGDVITTESLIDETKEKALAKIRGEEFTEKEKDEIAEQVAIGAIKYSILRQAAGKDIIFDVEQSLSFEGDSGPYLQYTHARTRSLLLKAEGKRADPAQLEGDEIRPLHKYLLRFPEVVLRAQKEREPHYVATYLIELAREFNSFYGNTVVLDGAADEAYKLALVTLVSQVLHKGLWLLGIPAPVKM